jgi:hypothetical protein
METRRQVFFPNFVIKIVREAVPVVKYAKRGSRRIRKGIGFVFVGDKGALYVVTGYRTKFLSEYEIHLNGEVFRFLFANGIVSAQANQLHGNRYKTIRIYQDYTENLLKFCCKILQRREILDRCLKFPESPHLCRERRCCHKIVMRISHLARENTPSFFCFTEN